MNGIEADTKPTLRNSEIDLKMRTLDHWRSSFAHWPHTIECSEILLKMSDHENPIFTGPGRIESDNALKLTRPRVKFSVWPTTLKVPRRKSKPPLTCG